jgi:hypothetical protein
MALFLGFLALILEQELRLLSHLLHQFLVGKVVERTGPAVLNLLNIAPFVRPAVLQPNEGRGRIWGIMLTIGRVNWLSLGQENLNAVMLVTDGAVIKAAFECAVCNQVLKTFAAYEDPMRSKGLGRWLQGDLHPPK